ncbi:hypothetical protein [Microbulbifer mangrovi]|uniref:hypothetical protein n=1 Tax=Microbulbifer mangrovi TaxID=927787 RepID=UPI00099058C6|nr:hypothetical protein [Microbulbifer mangrovi]
MKNFNRNLLAIAAPLTLASLPAQSHDNASPTYLPEIHAPAGVMADHLHKQGEWMMGYRYTRQEFSGLFYGSSKATAAAAAADGYSMVPTAMAMEMHMLDIMYAVNDNLTLMLMPQTMSMDMTMAMSGGGDGGMAMEMAADMPMQGTHSHGTSGIGDTVVSGLFRLSNGPTHKLHGTFGISAPTGDVDKKNSNGSYVHYGMQLGSGTWDLLPAITYNGARDRISWGAQGSARLPMEHENKSGFQFGERYAATAWSAYRLQDWVSLSIRLGYTKQHDINGHYNGPHNHASPADLQANYGGEFVDLALGANLVAQRGRLAGVRLGLEWTSSVSAHFNGYQLGRDDGLNLSLSYAL